MRLFYESKTIGRNIIEDAKLFLAEGCVLVWNRSGHTSRIVECRVMNRESTTGGERQIGVAFCTKSDSIYLAIPESEEDVRALSSIVGVLTTDMMKEKLHSFSF